MNDRRTLQLHGAKNQALFREVNERISELTGRDEPISFLCECADDACTEMIALTPAEYAAIRESPVRFPIIRGHDVPEIERVVEERDGYVVVEKVELGADVAARLDPRSRSRTS